MLYYTEVRTWLIFHERKKVNVSIGFMSFVFPLSIKIKFKISLHSFFAVSDY